MARFILPLMIDSRKIIHLDLFRDGNPTEDFLDADEYILQTDTLVPTHTVLTLDLTHQMLAAVPRNVADHDLSYVNFILEEDADQTDSYLIRVYVEDKPVNAHGVEEIGEFCVERTDSQWLLSRHIHAKSLPERIQIRFVYEFEHRAYSGDILLHFVKQGDVKYAGLDFGSESSQMVTGVFDSINGNVSVNHTQFYQNMKSVSGFAEPVDDRDLAQYESDTLYRSVFFINRSIDADYGSDEFSDDVKIPMDSFQFITKSQMDNKFFEDWMRVPNLKLIHDNLNISQFINFSFPDGKETNINICSSSLKGQIYSRLLRQMVKAYLNSHVGRAAYVHFALLVPNIYAIGEIQQAKKILREEFRISARDLGKDLRGIEINAVSESDATFWGALASISSAPGQYFVIVDCGKGTTDFSVVLQDAGTQFYRPVYRGGFAGAGNLITFAMVETLIYAMRYLLNKNYVEDGLVKEFFKNQFCTGAEFDEKSASDKEDIAFLNTIIFEFAEKVKKSYNPGVSFTDVQLNWESAKSGSETFETWFARLNDPGDFRKYVRFNELLQNMEGIADWNNYISSTVSRITDRVTEQLRDVVSSMRGKCGGILLTGRAFNFAPLKKEMTEKLGSLLKVSEESFVNIVGDQMKSICLQGVFNKHMISYEDIASTPLETVRGRLQKVRKVDPNSPVFVKWLNWIEGIFKDLSKGRFEDASWQKTELGNMSFADTQVLCGGRYYEFPVPALTSLPEEAVLLHTRSGLLLRHKTGDVVSVVRSRMVKPIVGQGVKMLNDDSSRSLLPAINDWSVFESLHI